MKADFHTYRRAVSVSIAGLVLQVVLAALLLVYGVLGRDHAAMSASALAGVGVLIWLALAIVFDQHKRERIEALEAEAMAAGQAGTSVFEGEASEFRVAAKRLTGLYRWFLPTASVLLGGGMIGGGILLLRAGRARTDADATLPPEQGWALGIGLSVAVIGFIFARYASGMGKQKVWLALKAGASAAIATALAGLLMAVAHFANLAGQDVVLRYLPVIIPGFMIFLGAEVFLNFLLDLYRPRKAGEVPPPAFESRVLGFVAAPDQIAKSISDAINYQLGFDVSGSWFYRLLSRTVLPLVLGGAAVLWLLTAVTVIRPHQSAIVLRWGSVHREIGPGLHLKMPWPAESVLIPQYATRDESGRVTGVMRTTTGIRTINLGTPPSAATGPILWTNEHARDEVYQIVQPSRAEANVPRAAVGNVRDLALVALELPLSYIVSDVRRFEELGAPDHRDDLLRGVARREVVRYMSHQSVEDVLGGNRLKLSEDLRAMIQARFDQLNPGPDGVARGAGIRIVSMGISGVHPPTAVAPNFEAVVQAEQYREAKIESARKDAIEKLTKVVGSVDLADRIVAELNALESLRESKATAAAVTEQEFKVQSLLEQAGGSSAAAIARASADRWTRHMSERGRAARYQGQLASFKASPLIYKASLYFEALQETIRDARLYVTDDRVPNLHVRAELQDRDTGVEVFDPQIQEMQAE